MLKVLLRCGASALSTYANIENHVKILVIDYGTWRYYAYRSEYCRLTRTKYLSFEEDAGNGRHKSHPHQHISFCSWSCFVAPAGDPILHSSRILFYSTGIQTLLGDETCWISLFLYTETVFATSVVVWSGNESCWNGSVSRRERIRLIRAFVLQPTKSTTAWSCIQSKIDLVYRSKHQQLNKERMLLACIE